MRFLLLSSFLLSTLVSFSKCDAKKLIGKWAGTYESNDGSLWDAILEIEKTDDCHFEGKIHWVNYFNTQSSIKGQVSETGKGTFMEIDILQGIYTPLTATYEISFNQQSINGSTKFQGREIGVFKLTPWALLDQQSIEYFEESLNVAETKFGNVKIGPNLEIDQNTFFENYLNINKGSQFSYESMIEFKTITYGKQQGSEFVAAKLGKYLHKETWGDDAYLNGHVDTISWAYDPVKDEVSWEKYTMDELGDNRFIDMLGQLKDEKMISSRKAWISNEEFIRLEFLMDDHTQIFYVHPVTMKVYRREVSEEVQTWKDYQYYQDQLIPKLYTIHTLDSKIEYRIDSLSFNVEFSDEIFAIPDFVRKRLLTSKIKRSSDYYEIAQNFVANKDYSQALRQIDLAIAQDNKNAQYYYYRGEIKSQLQDKYGAIGDYNIAIQLNPEHTDALNGLGVVKYNLKDYESAIIDFKKANNSNPNHALSEFNIGWSFYQLKQYDSSDFYFTKAVQLDSTNANFWRDLGVVNYQLKNYKKSGDSYLKAIEIGGENASILNRYGVALYLQQEYDSALFSFKKALNMEPEDIQYLTNVGDTQYVLKQYLEAIQTLEEAIKLKPENHSMINKIGLCYYFLEDYDYASIVFTQAIKLKEQASYYDNRAYSKSNMLDNVGAIEDFTMSIQLDPSDKKIWLERGKLQLKLHNNFDACSDFKKASELGSEEAAKLLIENCK